LLLDEGLPRKEAYFQTNNYHNIKHIVHDIGRGGAKDKDVYTIANLEKRLVVVFNTKDFKPLIFPKSVSVISLSTNLSDKQVDLKICKMLRLLKPSETKGHMISITNNNIRVIKPENEDNG
jgi:hypothetical protein